MLHLLNLSSPPFIFARGGGGGSGGGGGGGGGGSGGGGALSVIALIGYIPTHFMTARALKRFSKLVATLFGVAVAIVVTVPCLILNIGFGLIVLVGAIVGIYSGTHDWLGRIAQSAKRAKQTVDVAASKDPVWQAPNLEQRVREAFNMYQQDWSELKTDRLRSYMTPQYSQHAYYMMLALYQMGRRNTMANWRIIGITITEAVDDPNDEHDRFTASILATADDQLIDVASQKVLKRDTTSFQEFWTFSRSGNTWLLDHIEQATADTGMGWLRMQRFAAEHNMFYSLDWGTLLLPSRGRLFGEGSFKNSDINNHIIGDWEGLLVQLYTYIPQQRSNPKEYLIGQINLPKQYGSILIQRRSKWSLFTTTPHGYKRVSFEWPDFNKRYNVFATDVEKVTVFELLNPKTMADLYDADLPINIEVVDNTVYFYCLMSMSLSGYDQMIKVLQMAHKELKR